jgi:hypothetical protein
MYDATDMWRKSAIARTSSKRLRRECRLGGMLFRAMCLQLTVYSMYGNRQCATHALTAECRLGGMPGHVFLQFIVYSAYGNRQCAIQALNIP